jgi:hypothetical protein
MDHEDRERKFERALARHLRPDPAGARNPADTNADAAEEVACPNSETLGAFHERALPSEEMNAKQEHIAGCSRCKEVLAQLEATDEISVQVEADNDLKMREPVEATGTTLRTPKDISRGRGYRALRWAAPAGAIAAGLLVWIVAREGTQRTVSHVENVQVAQEQPGDRRLAESRPVPTPPAPASEAKTKQLIEPRRDKDTRRQQAEKAQTRRTPERPAPGVSETNADVISGGAGPRQNIQALPLESRKYSSLEVIPAKPESRPSSQSKVDVASAAPPVSPAASGDARAKSGALVNDASQTGAKEGANATQTVEIQRNGDTELHSTQQVVVSDQSELSPSLKKDSFENAKIIQAPMGTVRWRVGAAGRIERSLDSGVTWVLQNSGVKADLLGGSAPNQVVCWIGGRGGMILRTTDGGGHWRKAVSPMAGDVAGVQAVDAMTAEISDADRSARFVTHDGGVTWEAAKQ